VDVDTANAVMSQTQKKRLTRSSFREEDIRVVQTYLGGLSLMGIMSRKWIDVPDICKFGVERELAQRGFTMSSHIKCRQYNCIKIRWPSNGKNDFIS